MVVSSQIISQGAEATLTKKKILSTWVVEKSRTPKSYRNEELDQHLRKERTAHEARMLHEVKKIGIISPILYAVDVPSSTLILEHVNGPRLKNVLLDRKVFSPRKEKLCESFGGMVARLHSNGLIHGDLTTSNVLVRKKGKKDELVMIDFGLAFHSTKIEDLAVDLVNLKKTFTATHADFEEGMEIIRDSYLSCGGKASVWKQMTKVEQRIRYA